MPENGYGRTDQACSCHSHNGGGGGCPREIVDLAEDEEEEEEKESEEEASYRLSRDEHTVSATCVRFCNVK